MTPSDRTLKSLTADLQAIEQQLRLGGGERAIDRQHEKHRLTARERIDRLVDASSPQLEVGLWSGYEMYDEWGGAPAAGVVCVIAAIAGRMHLLVANDATVKAGAFFPATAKKVLRAQKIAAANRLPIIYLVDSAGVFLPLQEDVFPDEDDFGRIFRNNSVLSAAGIPQTAAIMGNCVAGGGYLPVLCDKLLMTDGSGLFLAGPALVKSAIGQEVDAEDLGGAQMHAEISGTIDYREPHDEACLNRLRELAGCLPPDPAQPPAPYSFTAPTAPAREPHEIYDVVSLDHRQDYEVRDVLACIVDATSFTEFKADYGQTLVCGTARIAGIAVGIVACQHHPVRTGEGRIQIGGVLYVDSAEKAARFVMACNQDGLPILFWQDINGFMVGRESERSGIIRAGAKLVNAISNSRVPKITLIVGGSFGAGNYGLCGKAFDPRFVFAWPQARTAVMGEEQATATLLDITIKSLERQGQHVDAEELATLSERVRADYRRQQDVRYAAARGWVDAIVPPEKTRQYLTQALQIVTRVPPPPTFQLGVFQV